MARPDTIAALSRALLPIIADVADDPRKLKPGQLCRILNSTPLGSVLTDRKLRAHRTRGGLRIGDGRTVDLFRYAAWLATERHKAKPISREMPAATVPFATAYEAKKERERQRNAENSRKGRDLGELPPVVDPKRKEKARGDLLYFGQTYFPERFPLAPSDDHRRLVKAIERTVVEGGLQAFAMPRGSGKTTWCEVAVIWALLTGLRKFVALIGANKAHADEMLESIKGELDTNELLSADWPEVCVPIQALEGINNRCKGQLINGERTRMRWAGSTIVLPTVKGSTASAGVLCVRGITGRVRGMKFRRPDGETVRPDLAIIDDPQTDQSAHSPQQCEKRLRIVTGAILGLAGPGKKIAACMPCTVIVRGDMADQILDRDKHPEWHGEINKLVYQWPDADKLWEEYAEIRRNSLRSGGDGREATAFYRKNRKAMDAGAKVAWPARHNSDELSAIQHAYNLKIDNPLTFDAEYQNEPKDDEADENKLMSPEAIAAKVNNLPQGMCPLESTELTGFIDVQHKALYWGVCAFGDQFTGGVVDYGVFPTQHRSFFTLRDIKHTLQKKYPGMPLAAAVVAGLGELLDLLIPKTWAHESGAPLKISQLLIDSKDGQLTEAIMTFCRTSRHSAIVMPSQGKGIGPADKPMHTYAVKPGDRLGNHWIVSRSQKYALRVVTIDTNHWKSFVHDRLATPPGAKGSLSLYGGRGTDHRMLAQHLTAESKTKLRNEKTNRTVDVWKLKPGRPDNHWFDVIVGCAVAASMRGISDLPKPPPRPRPSRVAPRVSPLRT